MTKHLSVLIASAAALAACGNSATAPSTVTGCHALSGSAFVATAFLTAPDLVLVEVQLQGDTTDQFTSQFSYGIPSVPDDAGTAASDTCFVDAPFGSLYLNLSAGTTSVNIPVSCAGGFADSTTSLQLSIGTLPLFDGGSAGTYTGCDGNQDAAGPAVPVQITPGH